LKQTDFLQAHKVCQNYMTTGSRVQACWSKGVCQLGVQVGKFPAEFFRKNNGTFRENSAKIANNL